MPTIPLDYTFLGQIALFLVLWFVLKRFWFDPTLRILHERTARSQGAIAEAKAIQAEAERLRAEHAAALDQARAEAEREVQEIVREAEAEQKRLLGEARADAQRMMEEVRARIAAEVVSARRDLRETAHEIARIVVQKVLGRAA
jgi:F-type H+-transporting ATPase subunit b